MPIDPRLLEFCNSDSQREIIQAVIDHGSQIKAGKALDKARGTISNTVMRVQRNAELRGYSPDHDLTHILPPTLALKGTSTLYHKEKGMMMQWVKTRANEEEQAKEILEGIRDALEEYRGKSQPAHHIGYSVEETCAVYGMGDAHFGMLADSAETKGPDFDSEIAYRVTQGAINYLVDAAPATKEAVFINVGDAIHTDDSTNRTRRSGAQLDVDGRYYRMTKVFVWAMIHAINRMLEKHESLTMINVSGNHDGDTTNWIQLALALYFENNPRVTIIQDPSPYHFYTFGKVLLGIVHGDGAKMEDLPQIMAHLRPQDWGNSVHRRWITGHIHHKTVKEFNGCTVESLNTLAPSDYWHARSGYFASREMQCMIFHEEHGLVARNICPVGLAHS